MRRYLFLIVFIIFSVTGWAKGKDGYVVATSEAVRADAAWMKVVDALVKKHKADVIFYKENIGELQKPLRSSFCGIRGKTGIFEPGVRDGRTSYEPSGG